MKRRTQTHVFSHQKLFVSTNFLVSKIGCFISNEMNEFSLRFFHFDNSAFPFYPWSSINFEALCIFDSRNKIHNFDVIFHSSHSLIWPQSKWSLVPIGVYVNTSEKTHLFLQFRWNATQNSMSRMMDFHDWFCFFFEHTFEVNSMWMDWCWCMTTLWLILWHKSIVDIEWRTWRL